MGWVRKAFKMILYKKLFLESLCNAIHGEKYNLSIGCDIEKENVYKTSKEIKKEWHKVIKLAKDHRVLPLLVETLWDSSFGKSICNPYLLEAKATTKLQAQRTADFLMLYDFLVGKGLSPVVMKGIIIRSLYPNPEQRTSVDEDLLISHEEIPLYHKVFLDYGLELVHKNENINRTYEISYLDRNSGLYLELHTRCFPPDSEVFALLNNFFSNSIRNKEYVTIYGKKIATLSKTDHLLFMLCHIFKHFLYGGFGIRQVCDIGLFSSKYLSQIDWVYIRNSCEKVNIERFSAAVFRIAERYFGFTMPSEFKHLEVDESNLLEDILTGGLYGVNDINRAHSSTITLEAVAKQKKGKKSFALFAAIFLPLRSMEGKYPYLKNHTWLLPVAWCQRVFHYILRKDKNIDPLASVRIGNERVALLREYGLIS